MRRSIVKLIARREMRDLLRDRRTLLIILGLPALLYPVFGIVGIGFTLSMLDQKVIIGVEGIDHLPPAMLQAQALLSGGMIVDECERRLDDPPLIADGKFVSSYVRSENDLGEVVINPIDSGAVQALQARRIDALLIVPEDFSAKLRRGDKPAITLLGRDGDETSKLAVKRLGGIVARWQQKLKEVRFARQGFSIDFDEPIEIVDPQESKPVVVKTANELRDMLVKFFPFLLVMWTMAGALHPAIDLTAGEKERGTMETLLISPAERSEIVTGKFVAVWLFSYASAFWNVLWMGGGATVLGLFLPFPIISLGGLAWAAIFALPLAAFFSAIGIGLGVFARSSKEGQYYLMPIFLLTMPLALLSMMPGFKLSFLMSLVPITGLSLVLQQMLSVAGEPVPAGCWIGLVVSLLLCVFLSLWWASAQFRREGVLFREAERGSLFGWFRSHFRKRD